MKIVLICLAVSVLLAMTFCLYMCAINSGRLSRKEEYEKIIQQEKEN